MLPPIWPYGVAMRRFPLIVILLAASLATSATAAEDKLGKRTGEPEQLLAGIGEGSSDAALEQEVAAAAVHPLGSLGNPVRVGGPEGERAYLARLRCSDGSRPEIGARAPGGIGAFGSLVGLYPLICRGTPPSRIDLLMDMYHDEHRETRAPPGLLIEPR
jgi:hypothetical protein